MRTCPVFSFHAQKPEGVPAQLTQHFDDFETDAEAANFIENEHHGIFECAGFTHSISIVPDLFAGIVSQVWGICCISRIAIGLPSFLLGSAMFG